jgi:hypothetical protein
MFCKIASVPFLMGYGVNTDKARFQKVGVKAFIGCILWDYFKELFGDGML